AGFDFDDLLAVLNNFGRNDLRVRIPVMVDSDTQEAAFVLPWRHPSDNLDLSLVTPTGTLITRADAGTNPNIDFVDGGTYELFRVRRPTLVTGTWTVNVDAQAVVDGRFELVATSDTVGRTLVVTTDKPRYTAPEPMKIMATPQYRGV